VSISRKTNKGRKRGGDTGISRDTPPAGEKKGETRIIEPAAFIKGESSPARGGGLGGEPDPKADLGTGGGKMYRARKPEMEGGELRRGRLG